MGENNHVFDETGVFERRFQLISLHSDGNRTIVMQHEEGVAFNAREDCSEERGSSFQIYRRQRLKNSKILRDIQEHSHRGRKYYEQLILSLEDVPGQLKRRG